MGHYSPPDKRLVCYCDRECRTSDGQQDSGGCWYAKRGMDESTRIGAVSFLKVVSSFSMKMVFNYFQGTNKENIKNHFNPNKFDKKFADPFDETSLGLSRHYKLPPCWPLTVLYTVKVPLFTVQLRKKTHSYSDVSRFPVGQQTLLYQHGRIGLQS